MKLLNLFLAIMFVVFAFVQINDPDPVVWILVYGIMAVICVLAAFEFYRIKLLIFLLVVYSIYSIYFIPGVNEWLQSNEKEVLFDDLAKMKYSFVEESREFFGLLICSLVLIFHIIRARNRGVKV